MASNSGFAPRAERNHQLARQPSRDAPRDYQALVEIECSKLARGADGRNPCDRSPTKEMTVTAAQLVYERCRPGKDALETPDVPGDGSSMKPGCQAADLVKFLGMVLPPKDLSFITSKIGGPQPPPGTDPIPR
jgi:hypothetical protein